MNWNHNIASSIDAARDPNTPTSTLEKLALTGDARCWLRLLDNPALPMSCFETLRQRDNHVIWRALALCPRTPPEVLAKIAPKTRSTHTLLALAVHAKTPPAVLESLSANKHSRVFRVAQQNPNNPLYNKEPRHRAAQNALPLYVEIPVTRALFERLLAKKGGLRRSWAGRNPFLPADLMLQFAADSDARMRSEVARNPKITEEVVRVLSQDPDESVRRMLSDNPSARPFLRG